MTAKRFGLFVGVLAMLSGCMDMQEGNWGSSWSSGEPSEPTEIVASDEYGAEPVNPEASRIKTVAVLLPLSGASGDLGTGIQHAIEIAFFQKQPKNIMVSFNDLSGTEEDKKRLLEVVLSNKPDMIIGPLFAEDAILLKNMKPQDIPAITFSSAKQALGNGIFTLALLPNQAVESIVQQIKDEGKTKLIIVAPETQTGYMLANSALESAKIYDLDISGMYMFSEGNADDMKDLAERISLFKSRSENLTKAKEILSDVLINQKLTVAEKDSVTKQLETMNKLDSLGDVPYDAVLFLGNAMDSKTLAAYLRYFDVSARTTSFYGSALWDTDIAYRDGSLAGGEYAGLPRISVDFSQLYSEIEGVKPNRFNTIGYDAAMLAIKSLSGTKPVGAYLLDPSGYKGLDGLVRLRPNGENERALQVMQLNGVRLPMIKKAAESNFIKPIYQTSKYETDRPRSKKLTSEGYNPMNFISLPAGIANLYSSDAIGVIYDDTVEHVIPKEDPEHIEVFQEEASEPIVDPEFMPAKLDTVDKKLIDEVKMKSVKASGTN